MSRDVDGLQQQIDGVKQDVRTSSRMSGC